MKFVRNLLQYVWECLCSFFNQRQLNIAILGLQNSGKTTLTSLLVGESFKADTIPTLGIEVKRAIVGQTTIKVYDLAGQQRFRFLWDSYIRKSDLIIYMMDLSDYTNWESSKRTLHDVLVATNQERVPVLVLGNKTDLTDTLTLDSPGDSNYAQPFYGQQSHYSMSVLSIPKTADLSPYHWEFMTPLLSHYDYEEIPKYQIDGTNQHLLKDIQVFSKEIGIDLRSGILHMYNDETLVMDRDIGIFAISCKDGTYFQEIVNWILQL